MLFSRVRVIADERPHAAGRVSLSRRLDFHHRGPVVGQQLGAEGRSYARPHVQHSQSVQQEFHPHPGPPPSRGGNCIRPAVRPASLGRVCKLNQLWGIGHRSVALCRDFTLTLTLSLKGEGNLQVTSVLFMVCKHSLVLRLPDQRQLLSAPGHGYRPDAGGRLVSAAVGQRDSAIHVADAVHMSRSPVTMPLAVRTSPG